MSFVSIVLMILAAAGLSVLVSLIVERIAYGRCAMRRDSYH
jgi:hypothetical protein